MKKKTEPLITLDELEIELDSMKWVFEGTVVEIERMQKRIACIAEMFYQYRQQRIKKNQRGAKKKK